MVLTTVALVKTDIELNVSTALQQTSSVANDTQSTALKYIAMSLTKIPGQIIVLSQTASRILSLLLVDGIRLTVICQDSRMHR